MIRLGEEQNSSHFVTQMEIQAPTFMEIKMGPKHINIPCLSSNKMEHNFAGPIQTLYTTGTQITVHRAIPGIPPDQKKNKNLATECYYYSIQAINANLLKLVCFMKYPASPTCQKPIRSVV